MRNPSSHGLVGSVSPPDCSSASTYANAVWALNNVPTSLWQKRDFDKNTGVPQNVDPLNDSTIPQTPVGWRLALKHPERITALVVQNGNAYDDGLKEFWDPIKAYWADGSDASRKALLPLLTLETTIFQYTDGVSDRTRVSPDNWVHDQALLDRPGNNDIQLDLFYDYRTNLPLYPAVQAYFRKHKPPTLIVWGKNDYIFPADGAHPYKRDLPEVEFHLINTGHFALEDRFDEMVPLIRDFLKRKVA